MKRLLVILAILLFLPGISSHSDNFNAAYAGHTTTGGWCQCGCPGCICDPGEIELECNGIQQQPAPADKKPSGKPAPIAELLSALMFAWFALRMLQLR